jgi:AcrR family transcriptional regulator
MAGKKKSYHHKNLRDALVEAAIPILADDGVDGLTLRKVARVAGVSHTAPYRHFRDKAALLEAIAAVGYQHLTAGCADAERAYPDEPRRQLVEAGMAYLFFVVDRPAISHLMFSGALAGSDSQELVQAAETAVGSLMRIIDNGKRAGLYIDRPSRQLTLTALATVHGLAMMIAAGMIREPEWTRSKLRALGTIVSDTLLTGLLRERGEEREQ